MIIAFTGKAGSGKTTAASLVEKHAPTSMRVERFSFAASLKQAASLIFGPTFSDEFEEYKGIYGRPPAFYGTQAQKAMPRDQALGGRSGRELLQELGSLCREFNEDVFLNHLQRSAPGVIQVIDDLRYPNEAARVQKLGGQVIGLRVLDEPFEAVGHASEADLVTHWDEMTTSRLTVPRGDLEGLENYVQGLFDEPAYGRTHRTGGWR